MQYIPECRRERTADVHCVAKFPSGISDIESWQKEPGTMQWQSVREISISNYFHIDCGNGRHRFQHDIPVMVQTCADVLSAHGCVIAENNKKY